jgi:hypothetical protein
LEKLLGVAMKMSEAADAIAAKDLKALCEPRPFPCHFLAISWLIFY